MEDTSTKKIMVDKIQTKLDRVRFAVQCSIRYHEKRQKNFTSAESLLHFVLSVIGVGSIYLAYSGNEVDMFFACALLVAFLCLCHILRYAARMSSVHEHLRRDFQSVEIDINAQEDDCIDDYEIHQFHVMWDRMVKKGPPEMVVLGLMAHNEVSRAMENGIRVKHIPYWRRMLAQWIDLPPSVIETEFQRHYNRHFFDRQLLLPDQSSITQDMQHMARKKTSNATYVKQKDGTELFQIKKDGLFVIKAGWPQWLQDAMCDEQRAKKDLYPNGLTKINVKKIDTPPYHEMIVERDDGIVTKPVRPGDCLWFNKKEGQIVLVRREIWEMIRSK